jgi:hypothetical protein
MGTLVIRNILFPKHFVGKNIINRPTTQAAYVVRLMVSLFSHLVFLHSYSFCAFEAVVKSVFAFCRAQLKICVEPKILAIHT